MDLLDFDPQELYFEAEEPRVTELLQEAAALYSVGDAETPLLSAYVLAPRSLSVLVGLYRFYYYRQRLQDAFRIAGEALEVARAQLDFPHDWRTLTPERLAAVASTAKVPLRFYLFTLKARGYLLLRLQQLEASREIFEKLVALDAQDRIGAAGLLNLVRETLQAAEYTDS
jgi:tetratricopeptide (TPR) repeat protein